MADRDNLAGWLATRHDLVSETEPIEAVIMNGEVRAAICWPWIVTPAGETINAQARLSAGTSLPDLATWVAQPVETRVRRAGTVVVPEGPFRHDDERWNRFTYSYDGYSRWYGDTQVASRVLDEARAASAEGTLDLASFGVDTLRALLFFTERRARWAEDWTVVDNFWATIITAELRRKTGGLITEIPGRGTTVQLAGAYLLEQAETYAAAVRSSGIHQLVHDLAERVPSLAREELELELSVFGEWLAHLTMIGSKTEMDPAVRQRVTTILAPAISDYAQSMWSHAAPVAPLQAALRERLERLGWAEHYLGASSDHAKTRKRWDLVTRDRAGDIPGLHVEAAGSPPFTGTIPRSEGRWFRDPGVGIYWTDDRYRTGVLSFDGGQSTADLGALKTDVANAGGSASDAFEAARNAAQQHHGPVRMRIGRLDAVRSTYGDLTTRVEVPASGSGGWWAHAASWVVATELARRHSHTSIVQVHVPSGMADRLWVGRWHPEKELDFTVLWSLDRAGGAAHTGPNLITFSDDPWTHLIRSGDPFDMIAELERAVGYRPVARARPTTPRTLTYRLISHVMSATAVTRRPVRCRNVVIDSSMGSVVDIPDAFTHQLPADALDHEAIRPDHYRYWVLERDGRALALVSDRGRGWSARGELDLVAEYRSSRSIAMTATALLGGFV